MKTLVKYSLAFMLTSLLQPPQIQAQPIFSLDETNIDATVQQIFDLYENQIGLSYNEVFDRLKTLVLGADPSQCTAPTPEVESVVPGAITLKWDKIDPTPQHYEAYYLDLNSGAEGIKETGETQITYQGLTGLNLFAFASVCGSSFAGDDNSMSGQSIIIVDVEIMFPTPPEGENCDCLRPKPIPIYSGPATNGYSTSISWPSQCTNSKYRLYVDGDLLGNPYYSDITFIHGQGTSIPVIYLLPWCDNNALSSSSGPVYAGSGGFYNASFSTSSLTITLLPSALYVNDMTLEVCACSRASISSTGEGFSLSEQIDNTPKGTLSQNLNVFPNPGSGNIQLAFGLSVASDLTIEAFDLFGKHMKTVYQQNQLNSGQYQVEVDTDSWPSGVYTFRLSTEVKSQVALFSKN